MLLITFRLGTDRYGIDSSAVLELLPLVNLKQLPHSPPGVAGILDYHGTFIPAIDLSLLATGQPAPRVMSTRIAVVAYEPDNGSERVMLAVVLEAAVSTLRREQSDFAPSGVHISEAPYLGGMTRDDGGSVQQIDVRRLIPEDLRQRLVPSAPQPTSVAS
jgi:chemotaxis-related protein WspB